jgi:hypothetical protein
MTRVFLCYRYSGGAGLEGGGDFSDRGGCLIIPFLSRIVSRLSESPSLQEAGWTLTMVAFMEVAFL